MYIWLGLIALAAVIFYAQTYTLFDFANHEAFPISTGGTLAKTFYFDDYKLVITGASITNSYSGCSNTILHGVCNKVLDHYDALGCPVYKYNKVNDYGCYTRTTYYTADPSARFMTDNTGCFWRGYLYYKDQLIKNLTGPFVDYRTPYVEDQYNQYVEGRGYTKGGQYVYLTQDGKESSDYFYSLYFGGSMFDSSLQRCEDLDGSIRINVPGDRFTFEVSAPAGQVYASDTAQLTVKVTQAVADFTGRLVVSYEVPTTIGAAAKTVSTDVQVTKGLNTYTIQIPTEQVTDLIKITPALELYYSTTAWTGYPGEPYQVGKITGDIQTVSIRPAAEREVIELQGQLLTAEEQIALLQASVERKALIIENISSLLDEQGAIIASLNLSASQNAQLIQQLTSKVSEQAALLASMDNTIQQNAQIITSMTSQISEQLDLIDELTRTQAEKDSYIGALLTNIAGQQARIAELSSLVKVNSEQILKMTATVQQQAQTIAALNVNLAEKEQILAEVYAKLDAQDDRVQFLLQAIEELQLDNGEIAHLLNSYETKLQDDAALITTLKLSNDELAALVSGYKNDLTKEQQLVSQLKLDNQALTVIISDYEQRLIEQQQTTNQLQASNSQLNAEIARYKANLITAEQLIQALNASNSDLAALVSDYDARLEEMAGYIARLNLTNEQLIEFVRALSEENEYQKQLLSEISQQPAASSTSLLIGAAAAAACVILYIVYKKRR